MFPTDNDIHRLISMKDADSGFFVLAVYSFIEAHMKSQMKECGLTVAKDDTFQTISGEYQRLFQRRFGRLSPKEQTFFREMKRRKQDTNRVRHEFAALSVEEARCAAGNLLLFYTIVDEEVKGKLRPLETFLGEWGSRNPPADSGKELLEANQRIQELGAQLQELMEQSQEYQQFKVEFQRLERRCQLAELEKRDSEEKAASYHRQLEEYRQLQEESQTKFGQYEDYICRLQRMVTYTRTRNEFERALLRLTAEQEEAVSRITFKKDYLVKGSAGTGKSLVLLKTIEKLLSQSSGTCVPLFVTFTKSLVKYNAYVASLMEMGLSEKSIRTADSFFVSIMEHIFPGQGIDYKIDLKDKYAKPLRNFLRETYPQQELDVNDVFREAATFIWPNLVTREEYIDQMIDRTGLLTPLRQELRQVYWDAITWLEQQLDREKLWWHDYAKLRVARALRERPLAAEEKLADYVFVDESQDLSVCSLFCIKAVCRKSLVLAGDRNQSIYRLPFSMVRAGIDVRGNSITLKTNFRNTVQINQVAERYRSLIPGMNQAACPSSFRLGPPVELLEVDTSRQNVYTLIAQRAQLCVHELGYEPGNICVIVNSNQTKQMQSIQQELRKCGLAYGELKDMDFSQGDRVCISTIQACKGLDFPVVILLADHRSHIHTGSYSPEQVDRLERNMFYVAMTRAMDMLTIVTTSKAGNPVVTDIKECVQAERAQGQDWSEEFPHVANSRPLWYPWWQEAIMRKFQVVAPYQPSGDQPQAIERLAEGFLRGDKYQTLKGVTGSGKTFTMAKIIEAVQRPTLIISHNKTLSAQLYREFKSFFPHNAVEYFVSYYDYYQPEAYVPARDLYIEKDASINDEIDRLRLSATYSLMERRDVIVVATVSCIYGLGMPDLYKDMRIHLEKGQELDPAAFARQLIGLQYERNDAILDRGRFRIRGDVLEVYPAYVENDQAYRIELDWDQISRIRRFNTITGDTIEELDETTIYPAKHFVVPPEMLKSAADRIRDELEDRVAVLEAEGKLLEAQRLKTRTIYDLEMITEMGYCPGIENYSGPIANRERGQPPATLLHYFPSDSLCMIDEAHVTVSQIGGMYEGDRSRKQNLIDFGFRLPSALDNRPLKYAEFESMVNQTIYVTATPRQQEVQRSTQVVEQLIRPTGLLDPIVEVRPSEGQMHDIYQEVKLRIERKERCLLLTLTKKMAEDLTEYLDGLGLKVRYIHSEVETIERVEILKGLRTGEFDVLIGINLLREGIDLPEVSFIAILDADKIGFLRSATSLIQIIGRAARNENGMVVMYADRVSEAMKEAIDETRHRRAVQEEYNKEHGITPATVSKAIEDILVRQNEEKKAAVETETAVLRRSVNLFVAKERRKLIKALEKQMEEFADCLAFEEAAAVRDEIAAIKEQYGD